MPRLTLIAALLALAPAVAHAQPGLRARDGKFDVEARGHFTRLVYDGTMMGSQYNQRTFHPADVPNILGHGSPWEALALVGAHAQWDPTLEPLAYYHRTGPVGAAFHHLRTRNGGRDATAPVGVCGLFAGTPAAYARPGQSMSFYSAHRELRELVERAELNFTYVPDARERGAKLSFRYGPPRATLADDGDKRFALLLVELIEEGYDPGDRLTLEAVRLYIDRTLPGGVVALHTSNKFYRLEPVVERIARELKLAARVWNDDSENFPGKTASSWTVLARSEADLGPLAKSTVEQILTYGTRNEPLLRLLEKYGPDADAMGTILKEWGGPEAERARLTATVVSIRQGPQAAVVFRHALRLRDTGKTGPDATLGALSGIVFGPMFHRLTADPRVELRTDAHRPALPAIPPIQPPKK
ncbi:MAG TPA: hypothetical protein VD866_07940 [Urbifossiella sp.]|nr:hypothetical protein [Urbifossiella sp.]